MIKILFPVRFLYVLKIYSICSLLFKYIRSLNAIIGFGFLLLLFDFNQTLTITMLFDFLSNYLYVIKHMLVEGYERIINGKKSSILPNLSFTNNEPQNVVTEKFESLRKTYKNVVAKEEPWTKRFGWYIFYFFIAMLFGGILYSNWDSINPYGGSGPSDNNDDSPSKQDKAKGVDRGTSSQSIVSNTKKFLSLSSLFIYTKFFVFFTIYIMV